MSAAQARSVAALLGVRRGKSGHVSPFDLADAVPKGRSVDVGDPHGEFPIYDSRGAELFPGRWNAANVAVIYAGEHYSTAMLEILAGSNGVLPPNQHYITITVPKGTSYEIVTKDHLSGWDARLPAVSRAFGARWVKEARSAILLVPSYVARIERNVVINPTHVDAK